MDKTEGNKLIAEFMAMKIQDDHTLFLLHYPQGTLWFSVPQLQYHSSWDWLMPVVEKIEDSGHATLISSHHNRNKLVYETCIFGKDKKLLIEEDFNLPTKIESVWQAAISFITWYNTQKQTQ